MKGWNERHSHKKAKRHSFPSNHFSPSFLFFLLFSQLFPFPTVSCCANITLYYSFNILFTHDTCAHPQCTQTQRTTQHSIHFIVFLSCSFSLLTHIYSEYHLSFEHHSLITIHMHQTIIVHYTCNSIAWKAPNASNKIAQTMITKKNGSIETSRY